MLDDNRIEDAIWDLLSHLAGIENQLKLLNENLVTKCDELQFELHEIDEDLLNLKVEIHGRDTTE